MQILKNFPGEHASQTTLEPFLFLNLLQINSAGKNRPTLETMSKFNALVPEKMFEYAPDMKHFRRAYLRLFLDLNV